MRPRTGPVELVATIGGVRVRRRKGEKAIYFVSGLAIDADGAPRAYHPKGSPPGLDFLANAGEPGNWFGIVTDNRGNPYVQTADDPAKGFYVSATSLVDRSRAARDPRRYVDSSTVPYLALPSLVQDAGARLGDLAAVRNRDNGKVAFAIVADTGPRGKIGEGSMALAKALGLKSSPKTGSGAGDRDVAYVVFTGSGNRRPQPVATIKSRSAALLEQWGGKERLQQL
jgi:glycosyl hydrolase group 75 (putative chitosanase)